VLPPQLADNAAALARFEREAKAVATLSHPNILALFDIDTAKETRLTRKRTTKTFCVVVA